MFSLIRRMFGVRPTERPTSGEPVSKQKITRETPRKRPLSIDSKKKEQDDLLLTKQKNLIQIYEEFDDVATTKQSMKLTLRNKIDLPPNPNFQFFSDLSDQAQELTEDLLLQIGQHVETENKKKNQLHLQSNPEKNQNILSHSIKAQKSKNHDKIPRKPYTRAISPKKLKKVQQICALCQKTITDQPSLKLACIHRFHQQCGIKMRERNRWDCDICEVKNKKQGSIINIAKRGKGVFSLRGSSISF